MPRDAAHLTTLTALLATLALTACQSDDDNPGTGPVTAAPAPSPSPAPAPTPAPTAPPAAVATTVTGAVVKGPVSGAQVCGYTVVAAARGTGLGSCTTSDAGGNYTLTVPAASGALWVEASGGSYTDEATAAGATVPAGHVLAAIVTANGGAVTGMLTPLTTLALNTARAAATANGVNGTLDAAAFRTAATQLLSAFDLPATLDIVATLPTFGTGINAYGTALTTVSRMVAGGTSLETILAAVQPQALAAAYAAASATVAPAPAPAPAPPSANGPVSASGRITSSDPGAPVFQPKVLATSPTPAFVSTVGSTITTYRFVNEIAALGTSTGVAAQQFLFTYVNGVFSDVQYTEVSVDRNVPRTLVRTCARPCPGLTLAPTAGGTGVTLSLENASFAPSSLASTVANPPTTPALLNGSLTGEVPGGYLFTAQLPRSTQGTLSIGGSARPVLHAGVEYFQTSQPDPSLYPTVTFTTATGTVSVRREMVDRAVRTVAVHTRPDGLIQAAVVPDGALVFVDGGFRIALTGQVLKESRAAVPDVTVDAALTVVKPSGSVTVTGEPAFVPLFSSMDGSNTALLYFWRAPLVAGQPTQPSLALTIDGGVVTSFQATSASGKLFVCENVGNIFRAKCAGSVTVSSDRRTLTFTGFKAGLNTSPDATISFDGVLTAAGT